MTQANLEQIVVFLKKFLSRKFIAWVIATIAFFLLILPAQYWFIITLLYIGVVSVMDYKLLNLGGLLGQPSNSTSDTPPDSSRM